MDGTRNDIVTIPAGGLRMPSTPETAEYENMGDNNWRAKDHMRTDGLAEFNFVQVEVPPMIAALLAFAGARQEDVDHYVFSQPNRFTLQKLADKMGIDHARMPMNVVENFGNSSGVTAPVALAFNLGELITRQTRRVCFAGFGAGMTWSSMLLTLGPLQFCEIADF
jgi:3-oxoacyl-[acyl-carrier-protein] synthase-3